MVGVPGRSKGCSTCRKRKKGCDRGRPTCTQCSNAGLECGGYQRDIVFLNHTQVTKAGAVPVVYRKEPPKRSGHSLTGITDIALPNGLAQTAYIEKYISIFLMDYLPEGRSLTGPSRDWIEIAHGLHTSNKATQFSLLSLGLFAAGETQYALQSYCFALRKLQTALSIPFQTQNDSTLATCQLLSLFEVSLPVCAANAGHAPKLAFHLLVLITIQINRFSTAPTTMYCYRGVNGTAT